LAGAPNYRIGAVRVEVPYVLRPRQFRAGRLIIAVIAVAVLSLAGCKVNVSAAGSGKNHHDKSHSRQHKAHHKQHAKSHSKHAKHHGKAHAKHHQKHHGKAHHAKGHSHKPKPTPAAQDSLVTEPGQGFSTVYNLINSAKHTINITMFEFADTTAEHDLAAAAKRGVDVRVILDQKETSTNTPAYNYFKAHGIHVVWSWSHYTYTHQKTLTFDNSTALVQTANLTANYYATSRDFLVVDRNPADIAAITRVFNADFVHQAITPTDGHDLVWSPTDSEKQIIGVITGAKKSLRIYSEEMGDSTVIDDLIAAAKRGVDVMVCGENSDSEYTQTFEEMQRDGVHVSYYSSSTGFYIHGKVVEADLGTPQQRAFIGSENFSNTSLNENRELGLIVTSSSILDPIAKVFGTDFSKGHIVH
jgi:cardiolipin synthase A/B